jgi:hypothetical protein
MTASSRRRCHDHRDALFRGLLPWWISVFIYGIEFHKLDEEYFLDSLYMKYSD